MKKRIIRTVLVLLLLAALVAAILLSVVGCPARIREKDLRYTDRIVIRAYAPGGNTVEEREITDPDVIADVVRTFTSLRLRTLPKFHPRHAKYKPSPSPAYDVLFYRSGGVVHFTGFAVYAGGKVGKYTIRDGFDLCAYLAEIFDKGAALDMPADQITRP